MPLVEIILFGTVAAFFLLRLYTMLGKRTGHEPSPRDRATAGAPAVEQRPKGSARVHRARSGGLGSPSVLEMKALIQMGFWTARAARSS